MMELPPYRLPMFRSLLIHMWDRSKIFLKKMGGVILIGSVIIWCLSAFPFTVEYSKNYDAQIETASISYERRIQSAAGEQRLSLEKEREEMIQRLRRQKEAERLEKSLMGQIGKALAPVFAPLGIDWRGGVALLSGFVAKEIVVSTMGVLYAVDTGETSEALRDALQRSGMTPLAALSMMMFVLLYLPCLGTVAAIRRETGSVKWMLFSIGYSTSVAWLAAFCVYHGGRLLGY